MRTRQLGQTDLNLTVIGLGTWAIGGSWQYGWGPQDDQDSLNAIFEAIDCGINWLDTAPVYGCGHSEEVIGQALKQLSPKPIIATKCGLLWNEKREKINCLDADSILAECEASLKRLGVEVIDLYQIHWPVPDGQLEEAWEAIDKLIRQGKIRYGGLCNCRADQMNRLMPIRPPAGNQPPYSMLSRDIEKDLLPWCQEHKIGVICYSPMQKGLLTGKFTPDYLKTLPPDDHRVALDLNFRQPRFGRNLEIIEELKKFAAERFITVAHLAIAWVLRRPEVTAAIVGARKKGQISDTAPAAEVELDQAALEKIEKILGT